MSERARDHACQVRGISEIEFDTCEVWAGRVTGRCNEHGFPIVRCRSLGSVLEFKPMSEDEGVPLGSVVSEVLLELGWGLCLDVAYLGAQGVAYSHEAFISARIPRLVRDWAGCKQGHAELGGGCLVVCGCA